MFHFQLFKLLLNVGLSAWRQFLQAGLGAHALLVLVCHAAHRIRGNIVVHPAFGTLTALCPAIGGRL